jgi:hypothetical protein
MEDPVAIAFETGSPRIGVFRDLASGRVGRERGAGRKNLPLLDLRQQPVSKNKPAGQVVSSVLGALPAPVMAIMPFETMLVDG